MTFGVIFTVDIIGDDEGPFSPRSVHLSDFDPKKRLKHPRGTWRRTEAGSPQQDYDFPISAHGKWVALLTKEQFREFWDMAGFEIQSLSETCGALGMPGSELWYGCVPAWSVDAPCQDALINAYFTPWPNVQRKSGVADRPATWGRVKKALRAW
jgi:hypothetical protein